MYKESDIKKIEDDFGFRGAKPYIYTKGINGLYYTGKMNLKNLKDIA